MTDSGQAFDQRGVMPSAGRLLALLRERARPGDRVADLLDALHSLLNDAIEGRISAALSWAEVPGAMAFTEGALAIDADIESAYTDFKIAVTGGASPLLLRLREEAARGD